MQVKAHARFIRVSPRKMNIMAGLIRRKSVVVAQRELSFRPERAGRLLRAVVESAAGNAVENHSLDIAGLTVAQVIVGQGPRLKRFTPKAFGRATQIQKPTSHITVVVEGEKTIAKIIRKKNAAPATPTAQEEVVVEKKPVKPAGNDDHSGAPTTGPSKKGFLRWVFQRKSGM